MDTRLAVSLFDVLPSAEKPTLGVKLLFSVLRTCPFNPAVWYRLAEQTSDTPTGAKLRSVVRAEDPDSLFASSSSAVPRSGASRQYWQTLATFVAQFSLHRMATEVAQATPAKVITVSASSVFSDEQSPKHLIDNSGMTGPVHDNHRDAATMWHTAHEPPAVSPSAGLPPSPAWVRFDFAQPRSFAWIYIWNHNQAKLTDRGFRLAHIYGSLDGVNWVTLTTPKVIELPRADGTPGLDPAVFRNAAADQSYASVIIAAEAEGGNYGSDYYGLSAVRFVPAVETTGR